MKTILSIAACLFCVLMLFSCQENQEEVEQLICQEEVLILGTGVRCCEGFVVQKVSDSSFLRVVIHPASLDTSVLIGTEVGITYQPLHLHCPTFLEGALCGFHPFYDAIEVTAVCLD